MANKISGSQEGLNVLLGGNPDLDQAHDEGTFKETIHTPLCQLLGIRYLEVCASLVFGHHIRSMALGPNWHVEEHALHVTVLLRANRLQDCLFGQCLISGVLKSVLTYEKGVEK